MPHQTTTTPTTTNAPIAESLPLVAPARQLPMSAPWRWLRLAVQDLRRAPALSLIWGLIITGISLVVSALAYQLGRFALLAVLLSGFVYVAPLLGVGLYAVSRALARQEPASFGLSIAAIERVLGQSAIFAICSTIVVLVWSRTGMMVTAFFPATELEQAQFFQALWQGEVHMQGAGSRFLHFLMLGSALGSIFALLCFAMTAVSLPMLVDKKVDMVTALLSSIHAVLRNKLVMLQWAAIIVVLIALGVASAYLGFILIMPLLGYGAWHAYQEALDTSAWPAVDLNPPKQASTGFLRGE